MGLSRITSGSKRLGRWALAVGFLSLCSASALAYSGHHHGGGGGGFMPGGGGVGFGNPSWQYTPNFGSLYANQPFTISQTVGFQPVTTIQNGPPVYNTGSVLALPGTGFGYGRFNGFGGLGNCGQWGGIGVIPGLAVVAPGWAGYPFYGYNNFGYNRFGFGYPYLGTSNFYYGMGFWPGVWGYSNYSWNPLLSPFPLWGYNPFYGGFGNGLALNTGLVAGINEIVQRGNARFGAARPVRELQARKAQGQGIVIPPDPNANGLNAIAPRPMVAGGNGPMDPLKPEPMQPALDAQMQLARANLAGGRILEPTIRPRVKQPPRPRLAPGEGPKPKALFPDAASLAQKQQWVLDRLQTGDRLARNGLLDEARQRYKALAETVQDQPAPWLRLAQVEVLAGRADAALAAWLEAVKREAAAQPGYSKQVKWSEIADASALGQAIARLSEWSASPGLSDLAALRATLSDSAATTIARKP